MGPKGNNVQKITMEHNVQIKFPEKAKAAVNGDVNGESNGHGDSDCIRISGKKEHCDAAAKALKALVPINIEVILNTFLLKSSLLNDEYIFPVETDEKNSCFRSFFD